MAVIGFLCVSLGGSTVQLHDCLVSSVQRLASVVKMATLLVYTTEEQCSVVRFFFFWAKGKCLSRKAVQPCWQTFRWRGSGSTGGAKVAQKKVKRLLCCGFRRTGEATGQVYQCWCRVFREKKKIFFFSGSNITRFTFYIDLWPIYWLSLVLHWPIYLVSPDFKL
jgi:hypothetical protein